MSVAYHLFTAGAAPVASPWVLAGDQAWPESTPEAEGVDAGVLATLGHPTIREGVLCRHGKIIWAWGNPMDPTEWASTGRGGVSALTWANLLARGGLGGYDALTRPVCSLGTPVASTFRGDILFAHALSYVDPQSGWAYSRYWREMDNVYAEATGCLLHDDFNTHLRPTLVYTAKANSDDGTPRMTARAYDAARWGALMLSTREEFFPLWYHDRMIAGGPWGDGTPYDLEGYQIHLIRHERAWSDPKELVLPGVPDGYMCRDGSSNGGSSGAIIVIPSLDLVYAGRGYASPPAYLPTLCRACVA